MSENREKRVLVTGAAGEVGGRLITVLAMHGAAVVGLDLVGRPAHLAGALTDWIVADLVADSIPLDRGRFDAIIHLAAIAGIAAEENRATTLRLNRDTTRRLLEGCSPGDGTRFVLASSVAAIGAGAGRAKADEDAAARPVSAYGESKAQSESLIREARARGIDAYALRLPTLIIRARGRSGRPTTGFLSDIANGLLMRGSAHSPTPADFAVAVGSANDAATALARLALLPVPVGAPAIMNLPSFALTPEMLEAAIMRVCPRVNLTYAKEPDDLIARLAGCWPTAMSSRVGQWLLPHQAPAYRLAALVNARLQEIEAEKSSM